LRRGTYQLQQSKQLKIKVYRQIQTKKVTLQNR